MKIQIIQLNNDSFTRTLVLPACHGQEIILIKQNFQDGNWEYLSYISIPDAVPRMISNNSQNEQMSLNQRTDQVDVEDLSRETREALYSIECSFVPITNNQLECITSLNHLKEVYVIVEFTLRHNRNKHRRNFHPE